MKKIIFALSALTLYTSVSLAANTVSCNLISMTNDDTKVIASVDLNCQIADSQSLKSEVGTVQFSCANAGDITNVSVKNVSTGEVLSEDRALSSTTSGSFSNYYLTPDIDLVVACHN